MNCPECGITHEPTECAITPEILWELYKAWRKKQPDYGDVYQNLRSPRMLWIRMAMWMRGEAVPSRGSFVGRFLTEQGFERG